MIDITVDDYGVDGYGAEGKVVKVRNKNEYDIIIKVPFATKESAEKALNEFARYGLKLEEETNE